MLVQYSAQKAVATGGRVESYQLSPVDFVLATELLSTTQGTDTPGSYFIDRQGKWKLCSSEVFEGLQRGQQYTGLMCQDLLKIKADP